MQSLPYSNTNIYITLSPIGIVTGQQTFQRSIKLDMDIGLMMMVRPMAMLANIIKYNNELILLLLVLLNTNYLLLVLMFLIQQSIHYIFTLTL